MQHRARSIRPFIGSKNYDVSRSFYRDLGFTETVLSPDMSVFKTDNIAFYLQDAYIKDWIDNTMMFVEVENVDQHHKDLAALELASRYEGVRLVPVRSFDWGKECYLHDPAGVLWHFGEFAKQ